MPVAGGGGSDAMTVLRAQHANNAPTAAQMLGFDIQDWGAQGAAADLNSVAAAEGWDAVVPAALQRFAKYDGKWISAPVNVHSTNWVWANKAIFDELGLSVPLSFDEMLETLEAISSRLHRFRPAVARFGRKPPSSIALCYQPVVQTSTKRR